MVAMTSSENPKKKPQSYIQNNGCQDYAEVVKVGKRTEWNPLLLAGQMVRDFIHIQMAERRFDECQFPGKLLGS